MPVAHTVAVVVPTFNRPALLREALDSIGAQTYPVSEVYIGQDGTAELGPIVSDAQSRYPEVRIKLLSHRPARGQGPNVQHLLHQVTSTYVLLLHDDDMLWPDAIASLLPPLQADPDLTLAFGNVSEMTHTGHHIANGNRVNRTFHRTPDRLGKISLDAAARLQMIPNNGFLIRTAAARQVSYDNDALGTSVDLAYSLALSRAFDYGYYVDALVTRVRKTDDSVGKASTGAYYFMQLYGEAPPPSGEARAYDEHLEFLMPMAIQSALRLGDFRAALAWCLSPRHRHRLLTIGGFKRIGLSATLAAVARLRRGPQRGPVKV